jgi:hypothetical protein
MGRSVGDEVGEGPLEGLEFGGGEVFLPLRGRATDAQVEAGRLEVAAILEEVEALGATVEAEIRNLVTQIPISTGGMLGTEQFYAHVPVDDLPGHSEHFYRWRTEGFTTDVRSAFTAMAGTRNAMGPFRFTMMGDQGTDEAPSQPPGLAPGDYDNRTYKPDNDPGAPHTTNVLRQIILSKPDFHLLAGDIAYADQTGLGKPATFVPSGNKVAEGLDKFNPFVWDVYLGAIEASASTTPWMFTTGNHDMESAYPMHGYAGHVARLNFPGNGPPACPSVYSFVHGNVAVLSLDSNDVSYEIKTNEGYSGGSQNAWVERTLAAHRSNPNIDFIVCFFHHCAYSTSEQRASDGGLRAACACASRASWRPSRPTCWRRSARTRFFGAASAWPSPSLVARTRPCSRPCCAR